MSPANIKLSQTRLKVLRQPQITWEKGVSTGAERWSCFKLLIETWRDLRLKSESSMQYLRFNSSRPICDSTEIYLATSHLKFLASSNLQSQLDPLAKFIDVALRPMKAKQRLVNQARQQPAAMQLIWFWIGRSESVQGWSGEDYTETSEGRSSNPTVADLKLRLIWAIY